MIRLGQIIGLSVLSIQIGAVEPTIAPHTTVVPRQQQLQFYPCMTCHHHFPQKAQPNPLATPHLHQLNHGHFGCLTCHDPEDYNLLQTPANKGVNFDNAHQICEHCHAVQTQDWYHGGHGKRANGWQQPRVIFSCAHCHNPHAPAIKPRPPQAPPPVRAGLKRPQSISKPVNKQWKNLESTP